MIADVEALVIAELLATDAVTAIVGDRISTDHPDSHGEPWIKITQLDASADPSASFDRLVTYLIQLDCYAGADGGSPEASALARTAREAIWAMSGQRADAVVSAAKAWGLTNIPDTGLEPARARYLLTASVTAHP